MIGERGVIFEKKISPRKNKKTASLNGDSGVGQASEFPSRPAKKSSKFFSYLGTTLILFSIFGFLFTYGPIVQVEIGYRLSKLIEGSFSKNVSSSTETQEPVKGGFSEVLNKTMFGEIEGVPDPAFSIIIPKIHAKSRVVADVDPSDQAAYMEALKLGVAHAKGTGYPGSDGQTIYLFAHSTESPVNVVRFNAVFYLLRELEVGDEIEMYYTGVKHRYIISDKKIVEPTETGYLTPYSPTGKEQLVLQTCWPPGTTLKRILVFAEKREI